MATVTLSDGRTLELRPMYISEKVRIIKLQEQDEEGTLLDMVVGVADLIEPAVESKSWEGALLDMTEMQLLGLAREWTVITEDDALPPESAPSSPTK